MGTLTLVLPQDFNGREGEDAMCVCGIARHDRRRGAVN